ncbi:MAG: hypothetical protein IT345_07395 [Trueperaceae bacterium]|nr:hypothetical protein [Trueperaceae bacterium]
MDDTTKLVAAHLTSAMLNAIWGHTTYDERDSEKAGAFAVQTYYAVLDRLTAERKPNVRPKDPAPFPKAAVVEVRPSP